MNIKNWSGPIPAHKSWECLDSTKVQEFMTCPRKFLFKYMMGLSEREGNIHLVHGEAWHRGMQALLERGYTKEGLIDAIARYELYFEQHYTRGTWTDLYPKNPGGAREAFSSYIEKYKDEDSKYELIHTEIVGPVLIKRDREMWFRIDAILRNMETGKVRILEHKTASRNNGFESWVLKTQTNLYQHVLNCLYDPSEIEGLIVNTTVFHKKSPHEHIRTPLRTPLDMMRAFITHLNGVVDRIEENTLLLEQSTPDDPVLLPFPPCTESCTKWGRMCEFWDVCIAYPNPLKLFEGGSQWFEVRHWDPRTMSESGQRVEIKVNRKEVEDE